MQDPEHGWYLLLLGSCRPLTAAARAAATCNMRRRKQISMCLLQFLADHVQMKDVRLYIRDALQQYARLQTFKPQPSWNALCYTGELLLEQFAFPNYEEDRRVVLGAYPWLEHWATNKCSGKITRAELAQQLRNP